MEVGDIESIGCLAVESTSGVNVGVKSVAGVIVLHVFGCPTVSELTRSKQDAEEKINMYV